MPTKTLADEGRFVSRLTRDTVAMILAGGRGSRLYELTDWRAKPGVYFGGKLRIIDFPLSNCINSGVRRIGVATQYKAHSLIRHLVHGWTGFRSSDREFVEILPASQRTGDDWYLGTADAVFQNLDILRTHQPQVCVNPVGRSCLQDGLWHLPRFPCRERSGYDGLLHRGTRGRGCRPVWCHDGG